MKTVWPIIRKEWLHIIRDPRTLGIVLVMPTVLLILFGYALSFDVKRISLAVDDADKTPASRQLIARFFSTGKFDRVGDVSGQDESDRRLKSGDVKMVIAIPRGFAADIDAKRPARFRVAIDGSNPVIARSAQAYSLAIPQAYARELAGSRTTGAPVPGISIAATTLYNPSLSSTNFIVPGIITLILMMIPAIITSTAIVKERESGTIEQLIVSPVTPFQLMIGKIVPYIVISAVDALTVTVVGIVWFGVPFAGDPWLLAVAALLYMLSTIGMGLMISTVAETQVVALIGAFLTTMLPAFLLSGFVFPISSMPMVVVWITYIVPARYFLVIVRGIFLKGVGFEVFWREALILLGFGLVLLTVSTMRFRRRIL